MKPLRNVLVTLLLILHGCYPTFNWRTVQTEHFGWEVLFPAKPKRDSRKINIVYQSEEKVVFVNRYSAVLNEMNFVIDVMSFEKAVRETDIPLQEYLNKALRRNFNIPDNVRVVDGVKLYGYINLKEKKPVIIIVKHLKNSNSLVRGAVIAPPEKFKKDEANFFLESIR